MDTKQVRLENLRQLWRDRFDGNIAAMARAVSVSSNQMRFYLNPEKPGGRWMGEEFARNIEHILELPRGWLDRPEHDATLDGLLATIMPILDTAPESLRQAVLLLAMKYDNDPAEGERIAAAIKLLVGVEDKPKP
jgi:hypothetical protein